MLTKREENQLRALERLLDGLLPYPKGTWIREMQDKRDALIAKKEAEGGR